MSQTRTGGSESERQSLRFLPTPTLTRGSYCKTQESMDVIKGERECVRHSDQELSLFCVSQFKTQTCFQRAATPPPTKGLIHSTVCMNGAPWRWAGHRALYRKLQMVNP